MELSTKDCKHAHMQSLGYVQEISEKALIFIPLNAILTGLEG